MDLLRTIAFVGMLVVAVIAGGAVVRIAVIGGDPRALATLGIVALTVLAAVAAGARDRRWRRNPYW